MSNKINVLFIIKKHLATIVNANDSRTSLSDWFTFLIFPLSMSSVFIWNKMVLDKDFVDIVVGVLSIFVGLLFSVLILVFDLGKGDKVRKVKLNLVKQMVSNISFSILVALLTITTAFATLINYERTSLQGYHIKMILNFIFYVGFIEFFLVLLMILKRMYNLLLGELEQVD